MFVSFHVRFAFGHKVQKSSIDNLLAFLPLIVVQRNSNESIADVVYAFFFFGFAWSTQ